MCVTVSIVVHNTPFQQLKKAVDCLLLSEDITRIYILDNGEKGELSKINLIDSRIEYGRIENRGYGAGHNVALNSVFREINKKGKSLKNAYHLVVNADVRWEEDVVGKLKEYMDENPDIGVIMPKVFYPDGSLQYACRMLPTPYDVFAKRFLPDFMTRKRMERYLLAMHDHDKPLNCPYLLGSFLFFRLDALKETGIFDERFFMYPEDIDITRRLHEKYKTMYWPGVSIIHEHQAASRKSLKMLRIHIFNMIKYFNKWGWFFDKKRKNFNQRLLENITYIPSSERPSGRG